MGIFTLALNFATLFAESQPVHHSLIDALEDPHHYAAGGPPWGKAPAALIPFPTGSSPSVFLGRSYLSSYSYL